MTVNNIDDIEQTLQTLSREQKIGQMLMARGFHRFPDDLQELMSAGLVGGIQVNSHLNTRAEIELAQKSSPIPLLVAADMENGFSGVGFGGTNLPSQMALGAIGDEDAVRDWARISALEAREFGVNFAFGPVLDMAIDPAAPMVSVRSFGSNPEEIIRLGVALVRAYQEHGLHVSAKHFPGAGRSPVDNHIEMVALDCDRDTLDRNELRIYKELIARAGLSGIMSGHIMAPAIDPKYITTVSPSIIGTLSAMNFQGVLVTDSLAMKGIKGYVPEGELIAQAMAAGHHLILVDYNQSPKTQFRQMLAAVEQGVVSPEFVDESARRILRAKQQIIKNAPTGDFNPDKHQNAALEMSRRAITLQGDIRPWLAERQSHKTLFIIASSNKITIDTAEIGGGGALESIAALLRQKFPNARIHGINEIPDPAEIEATLDQALEFDRIVFVAEAFTHSYKGTADFSRQLLALISGLRRKIAALALFGNPYAARHLPELPCVMFAYDGGRCVQAAAEALNGEFAPTGRLPVSFRHSFQAALDRHGC